MKFDVPVNTEVVEGPSPFDLRQIAQMLLEWWWLFLLAGLAAGYGGYRYASNIPLYYQARAVLQVEQESQRLVGIEEVVQLDLRTTEVLNTIVQNIKNTSVLQRVVRNNRLSEEPMFLPGNTNSLSENQLMRALNGMVTCRLRRDTRLIDVMVEHPDAHMARQLANSVAQEFIQHNLEQRFNTTKSANDILFEEATKLKIKLENSEREIQAYKELQQTVSLEERQNLIVAKLRDLNTQHTAAKSERLQLEANFRQAEKMAEHPEAMLSMPSLLQDPALAETRRRLIEQEANVAALSKRYKPKYPRMIQAQRQLDEMRETLRTQAAQMPQVLKAAYEGALARENSFEAALQEAQMEALELERKGITYNVLMREIQPERALYESVLRRLKETGLSIGLEKNSFEVVEPATLPTAPIRPATQLFVAIASLAGLLGSLGLVYLVKLSDSSLRTVDQAEHLLGLPVLAAIPMMRRMKNQPTLNILEEQFDSPCAEAFRFLRTSTSLIKSNHTEKKIILFTSADPNEGKTFSSMNYAICRAQEGQRTLLIDLDLRRPSVGKSFQRRAEAPGVTDYLLGKKQFAEVLQSTSYPNLSIMTAGKRICNPCEQLARGRLKELIAEASADFDVVVLDTAPINAVSDTFLVLHLAQTICLVVRAGRTPKRAVLRAVELMSRANFPPTGIILNFLPVKTGVGYYYYYAPKYGYGTKENYQSSYPRQLV